MALTVEEVQAVLSLKDELSSKLDTVNKNVDKTGSAFSGMGKMLVGAFSVAAVTSAVKSYMDFTGTLTDMSAKTGIGVEALQRLKFAAEQNGGSLDQVTRSVTKLGIKLAGGDNTAAGALDALGLSFDNIRSMAPDKAFTTIADAIAKVPDPMDRSKLAMDLFGKSGAELLPMMQGNLSETAKEADRLGIVMGKDAVAAGDKFGDSLDALLLVGQSMIGQVLGPMIPALTTVVQWLGGNIPKAISGARGAFDWLIKKVMEIELGFKEFILGIVELGAKVPWLGAKLGATSENVESLRQGVQFSKDALASFSTQTATTTKAVDLSAGSLSKLNLNYEELEKAASASAKSAEEQAKAFDAIRRAAIPLTTAQYDNVIAWHKQGIAVGDMAKALNVSEGAIKRTIDNLDAMKKEIATVAAGTVDFGQMFPAQMRSGAAEVERMSIALGVMREKVGSVNDITSVLGHLMQDEIAPKVSKLTQAFTTLPETIFKAFTGGGGIKGALNAFASQIGSGLFGEDGAFSGVMKSAQGGLTKVFGSSIGGAMGAAIPGIGAMIGPAFEALAGWIGSLFGNKTKDAILQSFGSYDALREKLNALGEEGDRMWIKLTQQTGRNDLASTKAQIEEINKALGFQAAAVQAVDEIAKKYNITIEEMGPAWAKQEMEKKAMELYKDYQILISAGLNHTMVIGKMSGSINEYVKNALKMGVEVPEAMRPMLQAMVDQGLLTDAAGNKITDLEKSGLSFSMTMSEGFKSLIAEVQKLTDAIARGLGLSLKNLPDVPAPWADWEPPPELPDYGNGDNNAGSFATGGPVRKTGLALVHQGEFVVPRGGASLGSGGGSDMSGMEARLQSIERLLSVLPAAMKSAVLVGAR